MGQAKYDDLLSNDTGVWYLYNCTYKKFEQNGGCEIDKSVKCTKENNCTEVPGIFKTPTECVEYDKDNPQLTKIDKLFDIPFKIRKTGMYFYVFNYFPLYFKPKYTICCLFYHDVSLLYKMLFYSCRAISRSCCMG